jgi:5'-deoxynucleotidase YfbR-like HD superfamily hydrolase
MPPSSQKPRVWQRMLSGRRLNLADPSPLDIEIEDIALGLSRQIRWNGQTHGEHGYSVAQHSVFVVDLLQTRFPVLELHWLLAGLLHDAPEYVCHDLITPLKNLVGDVFTTVETNLLESIHIRFGLPPTLPSEIRAKIKQADKIAAATEAVQLGGFAPQELRSVLGIRQKPVPIALEPVAATEASQQFLACFNNITAQRTRQQRLLNSQ